MRHLDRAMTFLFRRADVSVWQDPIDLVLAGPVLGAVPPQPVLEY